MAATGTLITLVTVIGFFAILALALNLKFGYTGILDFGHVAFFLIGAYGAGLLIAPPSGEHQFQQYILGLNLQQWFIDSTASVTGFQTPLVGGLGWVVAGAVAIVAAAFLGLIVALPAIRLREDYLAIALLGISVIIQRTVQTETYIANGPDSFRGYPRPVMEVFPIPDTTFSAALLLGLTIFTVWTIWLYFAAKTIQLDPAKSTGGRLVRLLLGITTLGLGYWAITRVRTRRQPNADAVGVQIQPGVYRPIILVASLIGIVSMGLSLIGLGSLAIVVFLGAASLATWVIAWMTIRDHYKEYTRREALIGLGLALGVIIVLLPVVIIGDGATPMAYAAAFITFGLFAAYLYGIYRMRDYRDKVVQNGSYLGLLGIATVWLLAIRYFLISLADSGSVIGVIRSTIQNFLWLVAFNDAFAASLNYRRFLMVVVIASLVIAYIVMEMLVKSPYGRVLKAIRDDENVALSLGKNTFLFKVQSMAIGSAVAGFAGVLAAIYYRSLTYTLFHPLVTFFVFLMVILGGKANNKGVILGATLYWIFVRTTVELAGMFPGVIGNRITILRNAIIGLLLVLLLFYKPDGLWEEERFTVEVPES